MKMELPPSVDYLDYESYIGRLSGEAISDFIEESDRRYFYWKELKYRPNMPFANAVEGWQFVKTHRRLNSKLIKFGKYDFTYFLTAYLQEELHRFDLELMGGLYESITPQADENGPIKGVLMEEAIASSQIEGAATTTKEALHMIASGREPHNESEQMILNNFRAIKEIEQRLDEDLSIELIIDIHQIMTSNTSAAIYAGAFRDHPIYIKDHVIGDIAFTAPNFQEVDQLVMELVGFVNDEATFYHPIIKASILHFMVGFIHPFGDGNGRTARALFYWYLMKKRYSLLKHISISKAILISRTSYDKAFLKTEYDQNDLNYFLMYSVKSLRVAFEKLLNDLDTKQAQNTKIKELRLDLMNLGLSKRQAEILALLYVQPDSEITINAYAEKYRIVRQTASKDLTELQQKGLLRKYKDGKNFVFSLVDKNKVDSFLAAE